MTENSGDETRPRRKPRSKRITINLTEGIYNALDEYRKRERQRSLNDAVVLLIEDAMQVREEDESS